MLFMLFNTDLRVVACVFHRICLSLGKQVYLKELSAGPGCLQVQLTVRAADLLAIYLP